MFEFSCKFPNIFKINVCNFLCDFLAFYRQFKNLFLQNCHAFSYKCIKDFFQNICHFLHDRISNFFLFHANLYIFFCKFPNDFFAKYFCTIMQMLILGGVKCSWIFIQNYGMILLLLLQSSCMSMQMYFTNCRATFFALFFMTFFFFNLFLHFHANVARSFLHIFYNFFHDAFRAKHSCKRVSKKRCKGGAGVSGFGFQPLPFLADVQRSQPAKFSCRLMQAACEDLGGFVATIVTNFLHSPHPATFPP